MRPASAGSFLVTPRPSERPRLGLGLTCHPPLGPGCATALLCFQLCPSLKREPRSSGSSVSVHVGPWSPFLVPLVPNPPGSTPSKCKTTLVSPPPCLCRLGPLWGAHAPGHAPPPLIAPGPIPSLSQPCLFLSVETTAKVLALMFRSSLCLLTPPSPCGARVWHVLFPSDL